MIYKAQRKQKMVQHELHEKGVNSVAQEGQSDPAPLLVDIV